MHFRNSKKVLINLHTKHNYITNAVNFITKLFYLSDSFAPLLLPITSLAIKNLKLKFMQNKITSIVIFLTLLLPITSYSMADEMFNIGLVTGIFFSFTILIVLSYVAIKIISNKEIKNKKSR